MDSFPEALLTEFIFAMIIIAIQIFTSPQAARIWSNSRSSLVVTHLCEHQSLATGLITFAAMSSVR